VSFFFPILSKHCGQPGVARCWAAPLPPTHPAILHLFDESPFWFCLAQAAGERTLLPIRSSICFATPSRPGTSAPKRKTHARRANGCRRACRSPGRGNRSPPPFGTRCQHLAPGASTSHQGQGQVGCHGSGDRASSVDIVAEPRPAGFQAKPGQAKPKPMRGACFGLAPATLAAGVARCVRQGPHRLVVRTSRCGRDNPGSTAGVDIFKTTHFPASAPAPMVK
jgi:hypothetical protein